MLFHEEDCVVLFVDPLDGLEENGDRRTITSIGRSGDLTVRRAPSDALDCRGSRLLRTPGRDLSISCTQADMQYYFD